MMEHKLTSGEMLHRSVVVNTEERQQVKLWVYWSTYVSTSLVGGVRGHDGRALPTTYMFLMKCEILFICQTNKQTRASAANAQSKKQQTLVFFTKKVHFCSDQIPVEFFRQDTKYLPIYHAISCSVVTRDNGNKLYLLKPTRMWTLMSGYTAKILCVKI